LHASENADTKVGAEDRHKVDEELVRPSKFGEEQENGHADDKESVDDSPEDTGRLVWDGGAFEVVAFKGLLIPGGICSRDRGGVAFMNGLDILDQGDDASTEYKEQSQDGESTDSVEGEKDVCAWGKHLVVG